MNFNFLHNKQYILNSITIADRIIFSLVIILIIWLYVHYWGGETLDYAMILTANHTSQVDLHKPQQITVQGSIGESKIEVADGQIRFIESPCKQQYCVHAGWLTKSKNFVTCLPNQISIELPYASEFDSISY
ncbi:NusG domain II-containing protein [Candidatus Halobeggiatoa sp. HSG11]|nr:NusG domain II-containing protein [Candidatus Halobeggiatoa sp. HSG11]